MNDLIAFILNIRIQWNYNPNTERCDCNDNYHKLSELVHHILNIFLFLRENRCLHFLQTRSLDNLVDYSEIFRITFP